MWNINEPHALTAPPRGLQEVGGNGIVGAMTKKPPDLGDEVVAALRSRLATNEIRLEHRAGEIELVIPARGFRAPLGSKAARAWFTAFVYDGWNVGGIGKLSWIIDLLYDWAGAPPSDSKLDEHPWLEAFVDLVAESKGELCISYDKLLKDLRQKLAGQVSRLPASAAALGRKLRNHQPELAQLGIDLEFVRTAEARKVVARMTEDTAATATREIPSSPTLRADNPLDTQETP